MNRPKENLAPNQPKENFLSKAYSICKNRLYLLTLIGIAGCASAPNAKPTIDPNDPIAVMQLTLKQLGSDFVYTGVYPDGTAATCAESANPNTVHEEAKKNAEGYLDGRVKIINRTGLNFLPTGNVFACVHVKKATTPIRKDPSLTAIVGGNSMPRRKAPPPVSATYEPKLTKKQQRELERKKRQEEKRQRQQALDLFRDDRNPETKLTLADHQDKPVETPQRNDIPPEYIPILQNYAKSAVSNCFSDAVTRGSSRRSGRIVLRLFISKKGAVTNSSVSEDTLRSKATSNCVIKRAKGWKFPKPKGGEALELQLPLIFQASY